MPVTNSFKWNRVPEDFEEFFGDEMQPFYHSVIIEDQEPVEQSIIEKEIPDQNESLVTEEKPGLFSVWFGKLLFKVK